jgi:hypothetical protein
MSVPFVLSSGYDKTDLRDEPMLRDAVNVGKPARSVLLLKELQEALPDL